MPKGKGVLKLQLIIAELKSGKTTKQIADHYGVTPRAVSDMCNRHGFKLRDLQAYKEHKADLLAFKQSQILDAMGKDKIKEASLRDQATTFNILNNAEKLERGQATSNVNINALTADISAVDAEIDKLTKLLNPEEYDPETQEAEISPGPPDG